MTTQLLSVKLNTEPLTNETNVLWGLTCSTNLEHMENMAASGTRMKIGLIELSTLSIKLLACCGKVMHQKAKKKEALTAKFSICPQETLRVVQVL